MNFPKINRDECPTAAASQCPGADVGGDGHGGDGDGGNDQSLILEPAFAILCEENTLQFQTFLASSAGQIQLTQGLTYSSSDPSILIIDSASGASTKVGEGIVTVTVHWRDLLASVQITCGGDGDCCADVDVEIAVVRDCSASMQQINKWQYARKVLKLTFDPLLGGILVPGGKDSVLRIDFSATALLVVPETTDFPTFYAPSDGVPHGDTDIADALYLALGSFDAGKQDVIMLVSDGQQWPALSSGEKQALLAAAQEFKDGGGLIICIGIAADTEGFGFLQQIASGGFLVNVHSANVFAGVEEAVDLIKGLLCLACVGNRTGGPGYGYGCDATLPGPQSPDPNAPVDVESGAGGDGDGGDLPQLPPPQFTPGSGTDIGSGLDVTLAIPGYPAATIFYSMTTDGSTPPNPSTIYSGPIHIAPLTAGAVAKIRARAILAGYTDSDVVQANYPQGGGTNGLPIIWANGTMQPASPYPSAAVVSGLVGLITSAKVKLKNINAQLIEPKGILLVGPDGTAVLLAYFDLTGVSNQIPPGTELTFDQAASGFIPSTGSTPVSTGSYKPTVEAGGASVSFPAPAPAAGPYATSLAAFNGKAPNGTWNLYVIHVNFYTLFGPNHIDGGWELILTTA